MTALLSLVLSDIAGAGDVVDPSLARSDHGDSTLWYDIRNLDIEGRGWTDTKSFYDRLPSKAEGVVREPVWNLSHHSAGMCVRFVTGATDIRARWTLTSSSLSMPHMPATGVSGLDLYVRMDYGQWRWLANGRPTEFPTNTAQLVSNLPKREREYMLYLPLYNGVTSVEIGIPKQSVIAKADPRDKGQRKPIVFYGTSITQGGCASRPGMVHTAILGRWLNYPVINLGFSGNGRMEPEVAVLFAELDPSVYVLECLPNMVPEEITERVEPFVRTLRKAHPETPLVLVEDRTYPNSFLVTSNRQHNRDNRAALHAVFTRLIAAGIMNLYYLPGEDLLGEDGEDTVDGSHPTDLGFMRQAEALYKVLEPILRGKE